MRNLLKILLISATAVLLLATAGIGIFLLQFDANSYREDLTALVEKQTGREFSIEGDMSLAPALLPTLAIEEVSLGNPDWAREPTMISIDQLETRIALLPLFSGEIAIDRIILNQSVVNLEIGPEGVGNWLFTPRRDADKPPADTAGQGLSGIDIRELRIEQANIAYHGAGQSEPLMFEIDHFTVGARGLAESLQVELVATYEGLPVSLSGSIGSLARFSAGAPYPLSLALEAGAAEGSIEGRIEDPATMTGIRATLQIKADSLADFNTYTDQQLPSKGPLKIDGTLEGNRSELDITDFKASLADSSLKGHGTFQGGSERPAIHAKLTSDRLNLVPYQPDKKEEKQKDEKLFSSQKLNLSGLKTVDANISLEAASVLTRDADFRDLQLQATLENGELRLKSSGGIADGNLEADIRLNASGRAPRLDARVDIENMLPEQLPALQEDPFIRECRTDIHFEGRGTGPSPAAIASSLNGSLLVTIGKGKLLNKATDIAGTDVIFSTFRMLNPLSEKEDDSEFVCGVLNFDIKDGIALAENGIAMQTSKVNVLGSGVVDLETEAIDFRAKPKAREGVGINLAQFSDVMHIGGTLSNPRPATDVKGALRTAGTVGAAIATGGLSLLAEGLFSQTFASDDPCGVALGRTATDEQSTPADKSEEPASAQQPEDKGKLERAGDAVKDTFKELFGD